MNKLICLSLELSEYTELLSLTLIPIAASISQIRPEIAIRARTKVIRPASVVTRFDMQTLSMSAELANKLTLPPGVETGETKTQTTLPAVGQNF